MCRAVTAVQDDIVKDIEEQPDNSSTENQQGLLRLLGTNIPLDSFNQDAEHQSHGENGVAKGSHHVRPEKAESALPMLCYAANPHAKQSYDHGHKVGEDGEGIGGQGEGVADVGNHEFHHKEEDAHDAHENQPEAPARVSPHGARLSAVPRPLLGRPSW